MKKMIIAAHTPFNTYEPVLTITMITRFLQLLLIIVELWVSMISRPITNR